VSGERRLTVNPAVRPSGLFGALRSRTLRAAGAAAGVAGLLLLAVPTSPAMADDPSVSFFTDADAPATANWDDPSSNELGIRFTSDVDGTVLALRFYKGEKNTGTHTGSVWSADGTQLATATFTDETASGWQMVKFGAPVEVTAGTTYVASYHTSVGFYSVTLDSFVDSGLDSGPLHLAAGGAAFSTGAGFPSTSSKHNYWVDVVFQPAKKPTPSPSAPSPSASATAAPGNGGGALPITGSNVWTLVGVGGLFVGAGGALFAAYRRRAARFVA
jgi:LPXTG-motif cell wall-anchored protein